MSWRCAQSEWESNEADEGTIISFDNGCIYYQESDVQTLNFQYSLLLLWVSDLKQGPVLCLMTYEHII